MKRRDLIKILEEAGCILVRHGGAHDWYTNHVLHVSQPIPRHTEINEYLARSIIRKLTES